MKITVIGAGNVGGLTAMRIAQENLGEVCLIDIMPGLAKGKSFDMDDARQVLSLDYKITGSEKLEDLENSDIIVMTAGLARKPGMTREDLLNKNSEILNGVCSQIKEKAPKAIVIIVTNPLDVMTLQAIKMLKFSTSKVLGMGVTLDASRFANLISKETNVSVNKISPCVLASHGEAMFPAARFTTVNGKILTDILPKEKVEELIKKTVERGKEIVSLLGSGSAYFAPAAAILQIVRAIVKDQKIQLGVCAYLDGQYGQKDVCAGVPCVIGKNGIEKIIELELNKEEKEAFVKSCDAIKQFASLIK